MWLIDSGNIERANYVALELPMVGDTIAVQKTEQDDEGEWRTTKTKPVSARVTRVRAGMITASVSADTTGLIPCRAVTSRDG